MKANYTSLKAVSNFSIIIGYILVAAGCIMSVFYFNYYLQQNDLHMAIMLSLAVLLGCTLSSVPFFVGGQFIRLIINVADDISTINDNAFFIANKLAVEGNKNN